MSEQKPSPVRWAALGALSLAVVAAIVLARKTTPAAPDAGAPAASDADAGLATHATVAIFDDGVPMAGRTVMFHGPSGRLLATTTSGADGKATGPMPSSGMITVFYGTSLKHLFTVMGVEPNDEVVVGEHDDDEAQQGNTSAIANVTLPGPFPEAARYSVELGVGTNSVLHADTPVRLPVMRRFLDESRHFQVLGVAYRADGKALAYTHGTPTAAEAGDTNVKLAPWKTDFRQQKVVLQNPGAFAKVKADFSVHVDEARFDHHVPERALGDAGADPLTFDIPRPLGEAATYRVEASGESGRAVVIRRDKAMPASSTIDLGTVPRIKEAKVLWDNVGAPPTVWWSVEGDATKAKAAIVQLSWPETKEHLWTFIAPVRGGGLPIPALGPAGADMTPPRNAHLGIALVDASEYGSYADVKKKWIHLLGELPEEDGHLQLSLTGDIDF